MKAFTHKLPSVSGWADPFIVCGVIVAIYALLAPTALSDRMLAVAIIGGLSAVMALHALLGGAHSSVRYPWRAAIAHSGIALAGAFVGLAVVLFGWDLLAEYHRSYYTPFFDTLPLVLAVTPFAAALGILLGTRTKGPSKGGDYQLGLLALGRLEELEWRGVGDAVIVWLIRGFFLPINFVELVLTFPTLRGHIVSLLSGAWPLTVYYLLIMLYAVIIAAVAPGYLFGARLFGNESKAVSHSGLGWAATLACYTPFAGAFFVAWFNYNPVTPNPKWLTPWVAHLQAIPLAFALVGGAIVFFTLIHLWGEAQFHIRSSNLANRGVITTGAYRFTKHPVYVSKALAWLLVWMPFASGLTVLEDVRLTLLWLGVCGIYALRALAEEELLAKDPDYVRYALWMDTHGLFRKVGVWIPAFSFGKRLGYWKRQGVAVAEAAA